MRAIFTALLTLPLACAWASETLTPLEIEWIDASSPVLDYAEANTLPVDIIVQPTTGPNDVPIAMGFDGGRCKLVFSLRDNPQADSILVGVGAAQRALLMEVMVAHELTHCWRHINGQWRTLPAGFISAAPPDIRGMQETRYEEGLADLVALAWTLRRHPRQYAEVHAWFQRIRAQQSVPGSHHDTRAWINLAANPDAFAPGATPFEQAYGLWERGLRGLRAETDSLPP